MARSWSFIGMHRAGENVSHPMLMFPAEIKGLYETEVKAELFEFPPTGHTCQNFQAIKMS